MISDEMTRIEEIRRRLEMPLEGIELGIGDDAAVLAPSRSSQVLSVDASVEGVHFERRFAPLGLLGRRALVASASDLAAMGARPRCALLSLTLPRTLDDPELFELVDGIAAGARELALPIVGGNLSAGPCIEIHSTVIGELDQTPLARRGARPQDAIFVTGVVGSAALGLELLLRGHADRPYAPPFVHAWSHPKAEFELGLRLHGLATAAVDVSDGLMADLTHLCEASGVGARIEVASLPLHEGFIAACDREQLDPTHLALSGGEQYTLLFTAPEAVLGVLPCTKVGVITVAPEVVAVAADGSNVPLEQRGYRHFTSAGPRSRA